VTSDTAQPARRLVDLLGMRVLAPDGRQLGLLNDVRLAPTGAVAGAFPRMVVDGLVVDGRHAGSLLGYDRRAEQGPRLVRWAVRWLHRNAGYLPWGAVRSVDWSAREIRVDASELLPLDASDR
jgi:hypothetical protein